MAGFTTDSNTYTYPSVTLSTNFNVEPYYDDFDETKNYHRLLFRPGLAVQARELTQMQTILQNQIDRFAEHIFQEGATVKGFKSNLDVFYYYVRIRDKNNAGVSVNAAAFLNKTLKGGTSGVRALVINTNDGSEANTPHTKTLFVKYTASNTSTGRKAFTNNEILTSTDGSGLNCNTIVGTLSVPAEGLGLAIYFDSGVIYGKDHFIRVPAQTLVIDKYDDSPTKRVGFDITESIITETADETLLDPAQGAYNYAAPGAARLKLTVDLKSLDINIPVSNTFIELMQFKDGVVQSISNRTQYSYIRDYLAQRTSDESGDYVVRGMGVNVKEHLNSANNGGVYTAGEGGNTYQLVAVVEPGKAYVKGYDIENIISNRVAFDKAIEYASIESAKAVSDYGNYVIVENVAGQWDVNRQSTVTLRDTQANAVSTASTIGNYSLTNFPGNSIGTARVRGVEHYTGTPGTPDAQYKLYLTDIKVTTGGKSFANVQSIAWNGGAGTANGKADIIASNGKNANTQDASFDIGIFKLPAKAIRKLRDTAGNVNNDFSFYKSFDISFNTSGVATLSTGLSSETFDGSGTLSDDAILSDFYVVSRGTANTSTLTGTVSTTSGSNTIAGSGTSFLTQVSPGDIIHVSNNINYVVSSITNNTSLKVYSAATATKTNVAAFKRFKPGQVLDFSNYGKNGVRSVVISGSPSTTATLTINETLNTALTATAIVKLNKIDGQEAAKTVVRNRLVQIRVGAGGGTSYTANTTGPWPLGLSDGFKLISVRKKSGSNFASTTEGTDVTSHFTLDTGMRDSYYDHAQLVKKTTSTLSIASGDRLLVTFDHFTHSYSSGSGYFSVDSYPIDDQTAGVDTTKIYTYDIPVYKSTTSGSTYDLRDCVDIRPRIADTSNSVSTVTNISINPLSSTTFDQPSGGLHFSPPNQDFTTDLDYYLKRNDIVSLNRAGLVEITKGTAALIPVTPSAPSTNMPIAVVNLAPYPSLPIETARRIQRADLANFVTKIKNDRFTMKDIGILRDRIDNLEYYTQLNLLEKNAKELLIPDENGLNRFKNGIIVDPFSGHNIGNVFDQDYKVSIDPTKQELRPLFSTDNTELVYTANSSGVVRTNVTPSGVSKDQRIGISNSQIKFTIGETLTSGSYTGTLRTQSANYLYIEDATGNFTVAASVSGGTSGKTATISSVKTQTPGDLVTLPYTHKVLVRQPYATTTRNAAGTFYTWMGNITLYPDSDYWYDTVQRPDVNINIDLNTDNWLWLANSWQTQWNAWQTTFVGQPVLTAQNSNSWQWDDGTWIYQTTQTNQTFTTPTVETRSGSKNVVQIVSSKEQVGQFLTDTNIQPFMRSIQVFFIVQGLKSSTQVWGFFDSTAVSSYITPLTKAEFDSKLKTVSNGVVSPVTAAATEGDDLITDSTGTVYGVFRIPNDNYLKFRTGTKRLRIVDNITNSTVFGQFTTAAETDFTSEGLKSGQSALTVSTKKPVIAQQYLTESRNSSFNTRNTITTQQIVGVVPPPPLPDPQPRGDGCGAGSDPIGQSFLVNALVLTGMPTSGMYLTKLDLYFQTKDSTLPVTIELREIDPLNGQVTTTVVPFSRVVLASSDVITSDDGTLATPVYFPSPVYLREDYEYAIIIIPGAVNPNYNLWTAVLGDKDISTGARVSQQPASGYMFTSANQRNWVPVENEDLKFTAYYADFTNTPTGTLVVKNNNSDHFTISNTTGRFDTAGEIVHGETRLVGTFANTAAMSAAKLANGSLYVQGFVSGATATLKEYNSAYLVVKGTTTNAKFKGGERIRIRTNIGTGGKSAGTGAIQGNSTGAITSATTPVGRVSYYDAVNYANTKLYVSNVAFTNSGSACTVNRTFTANSWIKSQINGTEARIVTIDNFTIDNHTPVVNMILPSMTTVEGYSKFATSTSAIDTDWIKININDNNDLNTPRYLLSRSIESNTSASSATMAASRSGQFRFDLDATMNFLGSPAIDLRRLSVVTTHNLISSNAEIGSSEDYVAFGGNSKTRYITRVVTLADGQDAEDLRVHITAYKPTGSEIYIYYKALHREDSDGLTQSRWIPMQRNTDQGFASLARVSSSENRQDFIEYVYDVPAYSNAARSGANTTNSNILEYRNTSRARFVGFKYFQIKIVLTNDTSSNPPRLNSLTAIALQR